MAELKQKVLDFGSVSVTSDGSKTYATIFNELFALVDMTKINKDTCLYYDDSFMRLLYKNSTGIGFTRASIYLQKLNIERADLKSSGSTMQSFYSDGYHGMSNDKPPSGIEYKIIY